VLQWARFGKHGRDLEMQENKCKNFEVSGAVVLIWLQICLPQTGTLLNPNT